MAGLATFNEKNIAYRTYIKSAMKQWLDAGFDAFRVDTLKHMPLWFWQEFVTDMKKHAPSTFLFGEYGFGKPWDERSVAYANQSGMSILDFGLCDGIRFAFSGNEPGGFINVQKVLDFDSTYHRANELVTFFDNHDMPRFLSITDGYNLELATCLLMTLRGIPCIFYGTEQYLVNNTNAGQDPYNRPMMESWDLSKKMVSIIQTLSNLRRTNPAIPYGSHATKYLSNDIYSFTRKYRDSRSFTLISQGPDITITVENTELPDGSHQCILSGERIDIVAGRIKQPTPAV
jgi:cyclomaltodextrin glucanotransferase